MAAEIVAQIPQPPTHIILQAGVGGLAAAAAAYFRVHWGNAPSIIVVEPDAAPALFNSIKAGHCVTTAGAVSNMGRLDCKEPSLIALKGLARDADIFCLISDAVATAAMPILDAADLATSPSGGAGLAALLAGVEGIDSHSRVLCILTEERDN
jgi:diaminopropionate ammonia-lyase